jgi:hypothetical protein
MTLPFLKKLFVSVALVGLLTACDTPQPDMPDPIENNSAAANAPSSQSNKSTKNEDEEPEKIEADPSIQAQVQVIRSNSFPGEPGVHHVEATTEDGVKWVMLNEVSVYANKADSFANPFASPWIEIYSRENQTFDLVGFRIGTNPSTGFEGALALPENSFIEFEGYLAIFANSKDQGRPVLNLKLTAPGEVQLWDPEGNLVDHIRWTAYQMPQNGSLSRVPDGAPGFAIINNTRPMRRTKPFTHSEKENFSAFGRRAK